MAKRSCLTIINNVCNRVLGKDANTTHRPKKAELLALANKAVNDLCQNSDTWTFLNGPGRLQDYYPDTDIDHNITLENFDITNEAFLARADAFTPEWLASAAKAAVKITVNDTIYIDGISTYIKNIGGAGTVSASIVSFKAGTLDANGQQVPEYPIPTYYFASKSVLVENIDDTDYELVKFTFEKDSKTKAIKLNPGTYFIVLTHVGGDATSISLKKFKQIGDKLTAATTVYNEKGLTAVETDYAIDLVTGPVYLADLDSDYYIKFDLKNINYNEEITLTNTTDLVKTLRYGSGKDFVLTEMPNITEDFNGYVPAKQFIHSGYDSSGNTKIKATPGFVPTCLPIIKAYLRPAQMSADADTSVLPEGCEDYIEAEMVLSCIYKKYMLADSDEEKKLLSDIAKYERNIWEKYNKRGAYGMTAASDDNIRDFSFYTEE